MAEQIQIQQRRHRQSHAETIDDAPVEPNTLSREASADSAKQMDEIDFELSHNDMFWELQSLLGNLAVDPMCPAP